MTDNMKEIKRLNALVAKLRNENAELKAEIKEAGEADDELLAKANDILDMIKGGGMKKVKICLKIIWFALWFVPSFVLVGFFIAGISIIGFFSKKNAELVMLILQECGRDKK